MRPFVAGALAFALAPPALADGLTVKPPSIHQPPSRFSLKHEFGPNDRALLFDENGRITGIELGDDDNDPRLTIDSAPLDGGAISNNPEVIDTSREEGDAR